MILWIRGTWIDLIEASDQFFLMFSVKAKDGDESGLCSKTSTGLVDIYEVKRSQRHLLDAVKNNWTEATINTFDMSVKGAFLSK